MRAMTYHEQTTPGWEKLAERLENDGTASGEVSGLLLRTGEGILDLAVTKPLGIVASGAGAGLCLAGAAVVNAVNFFSVGAFSPGAKQVTNGLRIIGQDCALNLGVGIACAVSTALTGVARYQMNAEDPEGAKIARDAFYGRVGKCMRHMSKKAKLDPKSLDGRMVAAYEKSTVRDSVKALVGAKAIAREISKAPLIP